ncbi:hypothetical protein ACLB2K_047381 [Fragaria x ananassa]
MLMSKVENQEGVTSFGQALANSFMVTSSTGDFRVEISLEKLFLCTDSELYQDISGRITEKLVAMYIISVLILSSVLVPEIQPLQILSSSLYSVVLKRNYRGSSIKSYYYVWRSYVSSKLKFHLSLSGFYRGYHSLHVCCSTCLQRLKDCVEIQL